MHSTFTESIAHTLGILYLVKVGPLFPAITGCLFSSVTKIIPLCFAVAIQSKSPSSTPSRRLFLISASVIPNFS